MKAALVGPTAGAAESSPVPAPGTGALVTTEVAARQALPGAGATTAVAVVTVTTVGVAPAVTDAEALSTTAGAGVTSAVTTDAGTTGTAAPARTAIPRTPRRCCRTRPPWGSWTPSSSGT